MAKAGPGIDEAAHRLMFGRFELLGSDRATQVIEGKSQHLD
ncbi:MAG: hypothetical protein VW446_09715 [Alphaproteobacteria bacterium]